MFREHISASRSIFPSRIEDDGPLVLHRPENGHNPVDSRSWFVGKTRAPRELVDSIFSESGKWVYPRSEADLLAIPCSVARGRLDAKLSPLYEAASYSLDGVDHYGFNRHDRQHIVNVDRVSSSLLSQAQHAWNRLADKEGLTRIDDKAKQRTLIAAWGHDLGNIFSRKYHSYISHRILSQIFPQLLNDRAQWRVIRKAMILHHESIAKDYVKSQLNGFSDSNVEQTLSILRKNFGPEALAVLIGDKVDVGRHRISDKPRDPGAIQDPHLETNLLGKTKDLVLSDDGRSVTWNLEFDMSMDSNEERLAYLRVARRSTPGYKAIVSTETHERFNDSNIPYTYFDSWRSRFWNLYFERNTLVVWALFALFPQLEQVELVFNDPEASQQAKIGFSKKYLARDFRKLEQIWRSNGQNR